MLRSDGSKKKKKKKGNEKKNFMLQNTPRNTWDVNIDHKVISKLFKAKTNSTYLVGYSVLIFPKMSGNN